MAPFPFPFRTHYCSRISYTVSADETEPSAIKHCQKFWKSHDNWKKLFAHNITGYCWVFNPSLLINCCRLLGIVFIKIFRFWNWLLGRNPLDFSCQHQNPLQSCLGQLRLISDILWRNIGLPEHKCSHFVISGECFASGNSYHTHSNSKVIFCNLVDLFRSFAKSKAKSKAFDLVKWYFV